MSFFPDFVIAYHKISIEKFSYFMMPCHQHSLCISSLFSDSVLFPSIVYSAWISRKGTTLNRIRGD